MSENEVDFDELLIEIKANKYDFVEIDQGAPVKDALTRYIFEGGKINHTGLLYRPLGPGWPGNDGESIEDKFERYKKAGVWSMTVFRMEPSDEPPEHDNPLIIRPDMLTKPIVGVILTFEGPHLK